MKRFWWLAAWLAASVGCATNPEPAPTVEPVQQEVAKKPLGQPTLKDFGFRLPPSLTAVGAGPQAAVAPEGETFHGSFSSPEAVAQVADQLKTAMGGAVTSVETGEPTGSVVLLTRESKGAVLTATVSRHPGEDSTQVSLTLTVPRAAKV